MKSIPNVLTALRLALTPVVVAAILRGAWKAAFWIAIAAGVTDLLDGLTARLLGVSSRTGAYLDPIADKLMLTTSYIALGVVRAIPWWMIVLVFARDIFILAMAGYGYFFTTIREFPPTVWGKLSTVVQIAAALAVVGERGGANLPAQPFLWSMVVTTAWSGVHYGWRGWNMLHQAR